MSKTSNLDKIMYEVAAKDVAWPVLPIIMADMESGEIVYISKYAADIFGYDVEELAKKPIEILIPEDIRDAHSRWRKDATVPKTRLMGVGRQIRGRKKDGTLFPVHVGLTAMTALGRQIGIAFVIDLTGVAGTARDPSSRTRSEDREGVAHGV